MTAAQFITLDNVTVRLRDRWLLEGTYWQIRRGENWVVWGANGAGKSTLAGVLSGEVAVVQGWVRRYYEQDSALCDGRHGVAVVSSEQYHRLYQQEQLFDEFRHFSGRLTETTAVADVLQGILERHRKDQNNSYWCQVSETLGLGALYGKPIQALSSGEMRKLLIGRALAAEPCLLILDEPFNGLDTRSHGQLVKLLERLVALGTQMVLIVHRREEIPLFFSHVLQVDRGRVAWQGSRAEADALWPLSAAEKRAHESAPAASVRSVAKEAVGGEFLIRMQQVTVRFGDQLALDRVDWSMRSGENWAITGPNGAGKSTLLKLITGDQLQAYANKIELFGRPRGSGESVWEIKQHIGYVGDELQARYQRKLTAFDVICSGFFDSVGLYRFCTDDQRRTGGQLVRTLHLDDLAGHPMSQLSFGQQRLILIARAMVKMPRLLILDEPCNGLDEGNRCRVLQMVETIAATGRTNLLYISHRPDEMPACITHTLCLDAGRVSGDFSV